MTLANVQGGKKGNHKKYENLRVLIDTGCSHSLILTKYCSRRLKKNKNKYSTGSGSLTTQYESQVHFTLPEFSDKKIINWKFSVADSPTIGYDLIIGRDLMLQLQMNLSFEKKTVSWEGIEIPMRDFQRIKNLNMSQTR